MCGIGGILRVWSPQQRAEAVATPPVRAIPESWLDLIDKSIKQRGPDGRGRFRDQAFRPDGSVVDVAFVHRRLSILDHDGGGQPMLGLRPGRGVVTGLKRLALAEGLGLYQQSAASELAGPHDSTPAPHAPNSLHVASGRVCVVFNGCLYNHRELRAELQSAGHEFSTDHSDTEVLVHGWRQWGASLAKHLDGMYALAIWDSAKGSLTLLRDRCGEKPLYLAISSDRATAVFGSSVPAVLLATGAMRQSGAWRETLEADGPMTTGGLVGPWLRFGFGSRPPVPGLYEVSPGETCDLTGDGSSTQKCPSASLSSRTKFGIHARSSHNQPPQQRGGAPLGPREAEDLVRSSVLSRLDADVDWGCFLSGGVDSSLLAAMAAAEVDNLRTFSVRMPDARYDESAHAERVASIIGSKHQTLTCDQRPTDDLISLIEQLGLPFGDSSLLPTYWVSRAARSHVTVAIGGDGADELFGGYERYRAAFLLHRFGTVLARLPASASSAGSSHPRSLRSRVARLAAAARADGYADLLSIFPSNELQRLFNGEMQPRNAAGLETIGASSFWSAGGAIGEAGASTAGRNVAKASAADPLRADFNAYLPQDLLRKADTASMACALELRSPYLASTLVDRCLAAPLSSLMPRGQRKGLLRQVARKHLPAEIVDRPKMGFAIPIGEWFRSDYGGLRTMLLDHLNSTEPFGPLSLGMELNLNYVRQMLDEHLGTGPSGLVKRDHSQRLYLLLVLSIWAKWMGRMTTTG